MPRLGIDVGGTFTDFVQIGEDGRVQIHKHLTTPADPSVAVLEGTGVFAGARGLAEISRIVHGTTLVANSLIERKGARTAMVSTAGFRDVVEIGREARYDLYDMKLVRPEPLVPRPLRFEVRERVKADGSVLEPLDVEEAKRLARHLSELEVESVAISFLHSYANPAHERQIAAIFAAEAPGIDVTLSSDIAPEWREYERSSTAAANAFVRPLVRRYLARLEEGFRKEGAAERLYILLSHGGLTSASVAAELAVQLVESGPAGGVVAAAFFGRRIGLNDLISFDMGGTTSKVSLVENGVPLQSPEFEVARVARFKRGSGLPLKVPTIELVEIGAGGGSIGHIDALGLLKVGPESASSAPGPACYSRGGTQPTVTDADLYLGLLDPDHFLGGEMRLRPELAEGALETLGARIGLDAEACARGIFDIVNHQMALALKTHVVERGRDPRAFALVPFGGAGPVHAYEVARNLGIRRLVYPPAPGVASALGFLVSPFSVDLVRTHLGRLGQMDWDGVRSRFEEMEAQAHALLERAGADPSAMAIERRVDMRYAGQGYVVPVRLPAGALGPEIETRLRADFDDAYEERFGSRLVSAGAEAVNWRVVATTGAVDPQISFPAVTGEARKGERDAYFPEIGGFVSTPVYDRYRIQAGTTFSGPALIEERETTIVLGPAATIEADELGNLLVSLAD
jgi:N-methylhydantoinase A